ncbi:GNAT family N-acetyltransferase [Glaciecola sp. 1036]|uniref:GNAT family N-acetyltransferase n=1 Tax=Alteromonadaceae TaxID=72275 RepID=UPI003CFF93DC
MDGQQNYQIVDFDQSQSKQWDDFIESEPASSPYHLFAWTQAVHKAYGYRVYRFTCLVDNKIVAILPVVEMKTLSGKKVLTSLPYCDFAGPIGQSNACELLTAHLHDFAQKHSIKIVEIRTCGEKVDESAISPAAKVRMLLPLPSTSEKLMAQFKSKLRSQIRKAEKNNLTYRVVDGKSVTNTELNAFYEVIANNMRALGSPVHSFAWYKEVIENYAHHCYMALVMLEDKVIAAGIVLTCANKASIPWASTIGEYNRLAPNMLLYWAVLEQACNLGLSEFDFGRSTIGEGTYKFKKQWGAEPAELTWLSFVNGQQEKPATEKSQNARQFVERIWRNLPLEVTKKLGPPVRKRISL